MQNKVIYSRIFEKQLRKAPLAIVIAFKKRRNLLAKDPFHPHLRNHPLAGKLKGYRSINITGDWRAIFSEKREKGGNIIVFELLGTHSQLYRK